MEFHCIRKFFQITQTPIKPNGYWTKERTFEESKKYLTRGEFKIGNTSAYYTAVVNKWLDEFFVKQKESD